MTFLDSAGRGCISGKVIDWPQLKPACKWAHDEITTLRRERDELAQVCDPAGDLRQNRDLKKQRAALAAALQERETERTTLRRELAEWKQQARESNEKARLYDQQRASAVILQRNFELEFGCKHSYDYRCYRPERAYFCLECAWIASEARAESAEAVVAKLEAFVVRVITAPDSQASSFLRKAAATVWAANHDELRSLPLDEVVTRAQEAKP